MKGSPTTETVKTSQVVQDHPPFYPSQVLLAICATPRKSKKIWRVYYRLEMPAEFGLQL